MRKIWGLLRNHLVVDFYWPYYLSVASFLTISLFLNAHFDFESIIDPYNGTYMRLMGYFLLYAFAYYGGLALTLAFNKKARLLATPKFWLLSLFGLVILSLDSGFPYLGQLTDLFHVDYRAFSWTYLVINNAIGFILVCLPLFLVYPFFPKPNGEGYGLITPRYDFKPYLILLMLMLPLIAGASFTTGFNNFYPIYKLNSVAEVWQVPKWVPMAIYEFFYGMDFFNVELLFRGFMVVGLSQLLGKDAIMPMVTTYCFLHFGKPTGEAISSVFGGYILGVLAYYTRGIWGGVIIHMGIALMMELAAYLQKLQ